MKKFTAIFTAFILAFSVGLMLFTGCDAPNNSDKITIVCTIFPEYDWVKNVVKDNDNVEVTLLLDSGVDLHSYQPTANDIIKISTCDMFIYVGGESDEWANDILEQRKNKDMVIVNLLQELGDKVKHEELVEGMEHEHEHVHGEIHQDDIKDRTLSEFAGEWTSLYPMLQTNALDEFLTHQAEELADETVTAETLRQKYSANWLCDVVDLKVEGDTMTFTYADGQTKSAKYTYDGYAVKTDEDGDITSVRYQFTTTSPDAPKYVQFNDHNYMPAEVEHFHVYFGDNGYEELLNSQTNPYFMPKGMSVEEIISELTGHDHEHEEEFDEHVWLSLKHAQTITTLVGEKLASIDSNNADAYKNNAKEYCKKLAELDSQYKNAVESASKKTLVFGDRFPFRYLVDDYNLTYYAAFSGCSAESEASFETVIFLAGKVDELGLNAIMKIEGNNKIAETVKNNTASKNQSILTLNSLQSITLKDVQAGASYLSIMKDNLEVLKIALN